MLLLYHETVTGSGNEISASNGPMLVSAPFNARAKPSLVISLAVMVSMSYGWRDDTYEMFAALNVRLAPSTKVCTMGGATAPIR